MPDTVRSRRAAALCTSSVTRSEAGLENKARLPLGEVPNASSVVHLLLPQRLMIRGSVNRLRPRWGRVGQLAPPALT